MPTRDFEAVQTRWTPDEILGVRASQSGQIKVEELSSPQVFWAEVEVPGAGFAVGVMLTRRRLPKSIRKPRIGKLGLLKCKPE